MTLEELQDENEALKLKDAQRSRAFQIVVGQVKTGLQAVGTALEDLPDEGPKEAAQTTVRRMEAKCTSLLAADYEGAMNAVQPDTDPVQQEAEAESTEPTPVIPLAVPTPPASVNPVKTTNGPTPAHIASQKPEEPEPAPVITP